MNAALEVALEKMTAERDRLQLILDSRPALNRGLTDAYIKWTQGIYAMEMSNATETKQ